MSTDNVNVERFTDDFTTMLGEAIEKNPDHIKLLHDTLSKLQKQEAEDLQNTINDRSKKLID